jgi:ABC-2 type transport system ATP-binding protein
LPDDVVRGRAHRFLAHLGLSEARQRRLGTYSKGMRGKVVLAAALLHDPQVLLLDEPLSGLDVASQALVASLLRQMAGAGRDILYSSHVLEQVEDLCDVLVLLHEGRVLWHGRVADLRQQHAGGRLSAIFLRMTASPGGGRSFTWAQLLGSGGA